MTLQQATGPTGGLHCVLSDVRREKDRLGSLAKRRKAEPSRPFMHSAKILQRWSGVGRGIALVAAERRPVGHSECTLGRSHQQRANSNRGSARAPRSGHRPISFRDTIRGRRGRPLWLPR